MGDSSSAPGEIITLPKGGGAIHGMGEKFSPDLHTGTGNFTIPIALPPGRNGFQPQLSLVYSSGNANGAFGQGWNLSIPGVTRDTSKGIPRYAATKIGKEDLFVLSGAEDLVPVDPWPGSGPNTTRFRPRTEGLFALIERIKDSSNDYWRVRTKDGLTSFYGTPKPQDAATDWSDPAVVRDPDPVKRHHIFGWKLTQTTDTFGNKITYEYDRDTGHDGSRFWDQVYLKRIKYVDYLDAAGKEQFLVSVTFNYGDSHTERPDAFSNYRAGFEIRTRWLCEKIQIETHPVEGDLRVRDYELGYSQSSSNQASLLTEVSVVGFDDHGAPARELPSLLFKYSTFEPLRKRSFLPITGPELPPLALSHNNYELVDLFGNGLPDILEMSATVRYWRNLGGGKFDRPHPMTDAPPVALADVGVQLIDANGDGCTDLLVTMPGVTGYYSLQFAGGWSRKSFQKHEQAPSFNLKDSEVRLVDLDGDGVTDAIRSGARFECYFNDRARGWTSDQDKTRRVERKALSEFPNVNFSDPRVRWADMVGDGLQDIVLVYDGNVEYWPNLGHGNWGRRVSMHNCPHFPYGYDPQRLLVGDVDGDGLADMLYVDNRRVFLWINQSGNRWSDRIEITGTPTVTDIDAVRLSDLLGTGVAGVLWSKDAEGDHRSNMYFLDLTGGNKPYMLEEMNNQMGAVTKVEYAPSTRFYVQDQRQLHTRWKTLLPFPVQVVAGVEVCDQLTKRRLTTNYRYHHGYWDGTEREFRGFGMVEQHDSDSFTEYGEELAGGREIEPVSQAHFSAPTLTKTWFHLGPVGPENGDWQEDLDWSSEFWIGDRPLLDHKQFVVPFLRGLVSDGARDRRAGRDAIRTLRGSITRVELYALDGSPIEHRPYTVTESQYGLREIDAPGTTENGRTRIFFPHLRGKRTTQWERGSDPLTVFEFTSAYDDIGQPEQITSIACPRGWQSMQDRPNADYLATRTLMRYARPAANGPYIRNRVAATTKYELTGTIGQTILEMRSLPDSAPTLRVMAQAVSYYDGSQFVGLDGADFGSIGQHGALVRSEQLVLTDGLLADVVRNTEVKLPPWLDPQFADWPTEYPNEFRTTIAALGGYSYLNGDDGFHVRGHFATTVRKAYDIQRGSGTRGMVLAQRDPLSHETAINYDQYDFLPVKVIDPVGLECSATSNYRVLQPRQITDPNGNAILAKYTPAGLLAQTWVKGKKADEGDLQRPGVELTYDYLAFRLRAEPISVRTVRYERHDTDPGDKGEAIETREYSDGFGRLLQTRALAEDVLYGNYPFGADILPDDITIKPDRFLGKRRTLNDAPNVVVSGWQVYDNKGRVIHKYESFFDTQWDYSPPEGSQLGRRVTMFYDPRGQVICTLNPDASEQRIVYGVPRDAENPPETASDIAKFDPSLWEAYTYDANDNAGRTHSIVAQAYRHHWNTPKNILIDALGRTVETVQRNRTAPGDVIEEYRSRTAYDNRGNVTSVSDTLRRTALQQVFDLANRRLRFESIDAGLRLTFYDAVGNPIETRDSKGAVTLRAYDDANRLTHLWARDDDSEQVTLREVLEYGDTLPDQMDARNRNLQGRLHRHRDEAGQLICERYDLNGNVSEKVRNVIEFQQLADSTFRVNWGAAEAPRLSTVEYRISTSCDALNRLTEMRYPLDVDGQRKKLEPVYNRGGALQSVKLDDAIFIEHVAYNARGQRTLIAYGNGNATACEYDKDAFRLRRMWTSAVTREGLAYSPKGTPLQNLVYFYDLDGNVISIVELVPGVGVRNNVDAANARFTGLRRELIAGDALVREFEYDSLYRLTRATGREAVSIASPPPWADNFPSEGRNWEAPTVPTPGNARDLTHRYVETYAYDPAGNMTKLWHDADGTQWARYFGMSDFTPRDWRTKVQSFQAGGAVSWGSAGNRLTNFGNDTQGMTHRFNVNGEVTQEFENRSFEWDHRGRLRAFKELDGAGGTKKEGRYAYDSAGNRVIKRASIENAIEVTIYIGSIFEHHVTSTLQNNTIHVMDNQNRMGKVRVGSAAGDDTGPVVQYNLSDHLGSSAIVVGGDSAGNAHFVNREEFLPFGTTSFGSFGKKRYRFSGKERDEETTLDYYGSRYYAPWLCRWMSCDPLGMRDSLSLYVYGRSSPLRYSDPAGEAVAEAGAQGLTGGVAPSASLSSAASSGSLVDSTVLRDTTRSASVGSAAGMEGATWQFDLSPYRPARSASFGIAAEARGLSIAKGLGVAVSILGDLATSYAFADFTLEEMEFHQKKFARDVEEADRDKLYAWAGWSGSLLGVRRLPSGDFGSLIYDYARGVCRFTRVNMPKASAQSTSEAAATIEAASRYTSKPEYTKGQFRTPECADDILNELHEQKQRDCNQPRACNEQVDDCVAITEKIAAGWSCIDTRNVIQNCFPKDHEDYEAHMAELATIWSTLRSCIELLDEKCF